MEIRVVNEKENLLFNRKEIQAEIIAETTPKKDEVLKILSEKFSKPVENISLKKIQGKFGKNNFLIIANIYNTKEDKESIEPNKKEKKEEQQKT